jgi:hypothetical protein
MSSKEKKKEAFKAFALNKSQHEGSTESLLTRQNEENSIPIIDEFDQDMDYEEKEIPQRNSNIWEDEYDY